MRVKVFYFAGARELAATRSEDVPLPEGSTLSGLEKTISKRHPALGKLRGSVRYTVNLTVAGESTSLEDGDEVGVLPPVAGG